MIRTRIMMGRFKSLHATLPALAVLSAAAALPAHAQSQGTVSRAVVQPLPPAASDDLNEALMRLARDRRDVDALISAGLASLQLDDIEAAIGFFGRAKELSPENPRIAEGMGAAYVRSGRPVEALRFFEEAEQAGIDTGSLWADRGLAYDLVGQGAAAQAAYRRALSLREDSGVRQRLALSHAIGGDRSAFEDTLRPLIDVRDMSALRTRAFGLAVLGDANKAIEIARMAMPREMATRLEPYLRFMPRLTKSQQAAAANLGIYPSAARIGRDDPRIASAAGTFSLPGTPDAALEPRGEQLGSATTPASAPAGTGSASQSPRIEVAARPPVNLPAEVRIAAASPVEATPTPTPAPASVPREPIAIASAAPVTPPANAAPAARPYEDARPATVVASLSPSSSGPPNAVLSQPTPSQPAPSQPAPSDPAPASAALDLATAFADFAEPVTITPAGGNVVDISTIKPKREVEEAAPPPPPAPRRIWLQLGIGQNRSLLRSDWRLKYRKMDVLKGKGPFVTPLGQTNRLLAGPFDSQSDARAALNALAAADIESFIWTSPEGQQIDDLR